MGAYPKQPTNYVHFNLAIRFREISVFSYTFPVYLKLNIILNLDIDLRYHSISLIHSIHLSGKLTDGNQIFL